MWPRSWSGCAPMRWKIPCRRVTRTEPEVFRRLGRGERRLVAVMDYGVKQNIIELPDAAGAARSTALPAYTPAERGAGQRL